MDTISLSPPYLGQQPGQRLLDLAPAAAAASHPFLLRLHQGVQGPRHLCPSVTAIGESDTHSVGHLSSHYLSLPSTLPKPTVVRVAELGPEEAHRLLGVLQRLSLRPRRLPGLEPCLLRRSCVRSWSGVGYCDSPIDRALSLTCCAKKRSCIRRCFVSPVAPSASWCSVAAGAAMAVDVGL